MMNKYTQINILVIFLCCCTSNKKNISENRYDSIDIKSLSGLKITDNYPCVSIYKTEDSLLITSFKNETDYRKRLYIYKDSLWRNQFEIIEGNRKIRFDVCFREGKRYSVESIFINGTRKIILLHTNEFNSNYIVTEQGIKKDIDTSFIFKPWDIDKNLLTKGTAFEYIISNDTISVINMYENNIQKYIRPDHINNAWFIHSYLSDIYKNKF